MGIHVSEDASITFGVPQGSVLGPTLFLVYINALCSMRISGGYTISYADDTVVVFTGTTWDEVKMAAESGLSRIAAWLQTSLLTLNSDKTNYICFTKYRNTQPIADFKIRIHNCHDLKSLDCPCPVIDRVEYVKYLGVMLDQRLSWHSHIDLIMGRVRKLIWVFKSLRHVASALLLNQIYVSLVQSVLTYCIPVWGGVTKVKSLELERAQRALLKVMYHKPYRFPTQDLYSLCGLLSVRGLYILSIILKQHKSLPLCAKASTGRRKQNVIPLVRTRSAFAKRQLTAQSAKLYNFLNKELDIYSLSYWECKNKIGNWLKSINYCDIEHLLQNI